MKNLKIMSETVAETVYDIIYEVLRYGYGIIYNIDRWYYHRHY
jgi:hypothetical protein